MRNRDDHWWQDLVRNATAASAQLQWRTCDLATSNRQEANR
jgi:hypothetical protein